MKKNAGFSLVEVLVVITVIALLIALLLPSLNRARATAQRTVCLSNTKGMSQSMGLYVSEWNSFMSLDQRLVNETGDWMGALQVYGNSEKLRQCPTASGTPSRPGTASASWSWPVPGRKVTGAYAFNGWLYNPIWLEQHRVGTMPGNDLDVDNANPANFYRLPLQAKTSNIPVFADAIWVEAFPDPADFVADLEIGSYMSCGDQMGRVAIARHSKTIDVVFYDGHSENIQLHHLWELDWNLQWKTPATLPIVP